MIKVSLLQERATEIESIDFVGCYTTRLKDVFCAVINIRVKISVHIQIFIPVKASFSLKGIQKPRLINWVKKEWGIAYMWRFFLERKAL